MHMCLSLRGSPDPEITSSESIVWSLFCTLKVINLIQNGTTGWDTKPRSSHPKHNTGAVFIELEVHVHCSYCDCNVHVHTRCVVLHMWDGLPTTFAYYTYPESINCKLVLMSTFLSDKSMMLSSLISPRSANSQATPRLHRDSFWWVPQARAETTGSNNATTHQTTPLWYQRCFISC